MLAAGAVALAPAPAHARGGALHRQLQPPLEFGWTLRATDSADVVRTELGDGRLELRIDHAPLPGVSTEMLEWWFQNLDGVATYRGLAIPAYRLWHPRDHIAVAFTRDRQGRIALRQRVHIQEVFARDPRFETDSRARLHRWDRRGIGLHVDVLGHRVMELDHAFTDRSEGLLYRSCLRIGAGVGPLRATLNTIARPQFGPEKASAWLRHNIEEVGCFAEFLPELYANRAIAPAAA